MTGAENGLFGLCRFLSLILLLFVTAYRQKKLSCLR
jgi:hypothetical protein